MTAACIDVRCAEDLRDIVQRAAQSLADGELVGLPTETVYGLAANALDERAVGRLLDAKGRTEGHPLTLALRDAATMFDFVPDVSPLGQRFARRAWPGPITLVLAGDHPDGLLNRLPEKTRAAVSPNKWIGMRVPGHPLVLDILRLLPGPIVLSSANRTGQPDALTAQAVLKALGDDVQMVLDDGPCRYGTASTVVRVDGNRFEILRQGVIAESTLQRLSKMMILFVCTGNTCRSPMAEALARGFLAKRLGCAPDVLEENGVIVASAGVGAGLGSPASGEACRVMRNMGLSLDDHHAQPVNEHLVRHADVIFTMGRSHRDVIVVRWPDAAPRVRLLSASGNEICDPIGGSAECYERCAAQIQSELETQLNAIEW